GESRGDQGSRVSECRPRRGGGQASCDDGRRCLRRRPRGERDARRAQAGIERTGSGTHRARAPAPRPRGPPGTRGLRVSPSSRGRGVQRPSSDAILEHRLRKRRRQRTKARRRKFARFVVGPTIVVVLVLAVSGFTGAAVWMSSCNLDSLRPVEVGQNSFIFAADGSLLGSIPAEKNREPVPMSQMSPWVPKATVAI